LIVVCLFIKADRQIPCINFIILNSFSDWPSATTFLTIRGES
jgi:hypothetical protein